MLQDGGYPVQGDVNPAVSFHFPSADFAYLILITYLQDATMGQYAELYDPDHGIIVPIQNYSPQEVAKGTDQYPALQRWSDVVFLTWASVCQKTGGSEKVKGLKHFFRYHIKPKSTPTLNIILEALGVKGPADVKIWPPNQDHIDGQTFDANSDGGKALIGTPHGSGICWFLWQHQDDLGTKTIDKITVFRTTAPGEDEKMNDWVNLHFLIKEAEKK